jgi:hypothetical protein
MLGFLRGLAGRERAPEAKPRAAERAPLSAELPGREPFIFADHLEWHEGFPHLRWDEASRWAMRGATADEDAAAWEACCNGWRLHLRDALGAGYRVDESETAVVLSSLDARHAKAALAFMEKTQRRILHLLKGIARAPDLGKELLVVLDDKDTYYRYVSRFYPDAGEFAFSGGMHVDQGASYYVTVKADVRAVEPVIAHEMTHGSVAHLSLPLWLNEGLAVNTEHALVGAGSALHTPVEMHARHLKFWGPAEIQDFWSGASFHRMDDANALSYDLGRVLVDQLSRDWARFAAFANAARYEDAGAAAARQHLQIDLARLVAALLEKEPASDFEPDPEKWKGAADHAPASLATSPG